jgi:uncharacterized protein (DUF2236 family)
VGQLKKVIVDDHCRQIGRHDQPEVFGGPPGDPGLIGPGSVSWELHSDVAAIAIGGVGAIVMEILHPSVMAGVQDLSSYREDPFRRGRTTYGYVVTTTFGNTKAATRLIAAVKRIHGRVNGVRPDGVPYRALDPELIGWVHTCIPWAVMQAFERFNRPLSDDERGRYLAEQAVIGRMGGAAEIPETAADLEDYVEAMRPKLTVNEQTREFFEFLLTAPFGVTLPGPLSRRMNRFQLESGMSLMPEWAQRLSGFEPSELARRTLHEPSLRAYARTLRWAFGTPPFRALADERVAGSSVEEPAELAVA